MMPCNCSEILGTEHCPDHGDKPSAPSTLRERLRRKARWISTKPIERPGEDEKSEQWVRLSDVLRELEQEKL